MLVAVGRPGWSQDSTNTGLTGLLNFKKKILEKYIRIFYLLLSLENLQLTEPNLTGIFFPPEPNDYSVSITIITVGRRKLTEY